MAVFHTKRGHLMQQSYLNTDLVLAHRQPPTNLLAHLDANGFVVLWTGNNDDGVCWSNLELAKQHNTPEETIADIVRVIEGLTVPAKTEWDAAVTRVLDMGFDGGIEPRLAVDTLSAGLLGRIARAGCSLKITRYSYTEEGKNQ